MASSARRFRELAFCGGLTLLLYPVSWLVRRFVELDDAKLAVGFTFFWAAWVINDPHFAVTYVLFYRDARRRALGGSGWPLALRVRCIFAGLIVPVVLATWAIHAITTRSAAALGLFIQVMFFTVGWHYVKQGFGVMVVMCARRGVRFAPVERYAILAHCFAGWAYAWASPYDPGREVEEKGVIYRTIAHPVGLERATFAILLATVVPLAIVLVRKWVRERPPIAGPVLVMLLGVWSWSIYSNVDPLVVYAVPALHSIQYLYMVWLLRRNEARSKAGPPWFESVPTRVGILAASALGLGVLFFHLGPTLLDDALTPKKSAFTDLGPTPWFAALYAFVNVHHYFMDNVIWRRENPDTARLVDPDEISAEPPEPSLRTSVEA